jgi:tetratricopeptide (TPR) repeat protein
MSKAEVAARLPALLARLNPAGQHPGHWTTPDTPPGWVDAVQAALAPDSLIAGRRAAAQLLLATAQARGWQDARLGLAYFALGRVTGNPAAYQSAAAIFATLPDGGVHLAHALLPLAAQSLSDGDPQTALALCDRALPLASRAQNAALMANLMLVKAEALARLGQVDAAQRLRLDSLPAARYGFGSAQVLQARAAVVASLAR